MSAASSHVAFPEATPRLDEATCALETPFAKPGADIDTASFEPAFELEHAKTSALHLLTDAVLPRCDPPTAWPKARLAHVTRGIVAVLTDFHRARPEEFGMPALELKGTLPGTIPTKAFLALLGDLTQTRAIESSGPRIQLRGHVVAFEAADRVPWERCLARLLDHGMHPFTAREVARDLGIPQAAVSELFCRRHALGDLSRLDEERYLTAAQVAALAATAAEAAAQDQRPGLTAAHFRDVIGAGRNLTVRILEFLDDIGVTRREGDIRTMAPDYELLVGLAPRDKPAATRPPRPRPPHGRARCRRTP